MRKLRWEAPPRQIPKHPYRDSAIVYAVLACAVVGAAAATGGNIRRAVGIAFVVFVVATVYSWWRWRQRIRQEQRQ